MRFLLFFQNGILAAAIGGVIWAFAAPLGQAQTSATISATKAAQEGLVRADQMDRGALLFKTDMPGYYVPAPLLSTDIAVSVSGTVARTVLTQRFTNPAQVFVEGKYLFPLPEGAAVDTLKMRVADRLIEGKVKERAEAKVIYEKAKAEGYVASLVEQERPNIFTNSVANIAPNATIVIQIAYQETLQPRDGAYGMRIPLVVAPRYKPEPRILLAKFGPDGWTPAPVDPVPDHDRVAAAMINPADINDGEIHNPVDISIDLNAGFPLGPVQSLYHEVVVRPNSAGGAQIFLDGAAPADRDFYLSWTPETIRAPHAASFQEPVHNENHFLVMLTPPAKSEVDAVRTPREVIFVQDVSGSMSFGGVEENRSSMAQAKAGLEMALKRLTPKDSFNLIVFNDRFAPFSPEPIPATAANIDQAVEAVRGLEADGGTEMLPALAFALQDNSPDDGKIRQVIFLTDGAVSNEREMIQLIKRELGESRLFTVGIGSAPNSYFMTAAAESGRGGHVFIGDLSEVQEKMAALFTKIETPAITDLNIVSDGLSNPEIFPSPLPDLYVGDPIALAITASAFDAQSDPKVTITGRQGDEKWSKTIHLKDAVEREGIARLSAKRRIKSLESLRLSPDIGQDERKRIDATILETALAAHLVSRLTSLVAVDVTPTRPTGEPMSATEIPLNLPDGWDPAVFFDAERDNAAPTQAVIHKARFQRLAVAADQRQAALRRAAAPATSIGWRIWLLFGVMTIAIGAALIVRSRQRNSTG